MNKDFYNDLPGIVCIMLDELIEKYSKEKWFEKAWEQYRQHILSSSMDDMKMPGFVFNKYLKREAHKLYMREYYKKNKEQIKERRKKYYQEHKEQEKEAKRKREKNNKEQYKEMYHNYYIKHKEKYMKKSKQWRENNKDKFLKSIHNSRKKRVKKLREQGITNAWSVVNYGKKPKYNLESKGE